MRDKIDYLQLAKRKRTVLVDSKNSVYVNKNVKPRKKGGKKTQITNSF